MFNALHLVDLVMIGLVLRWPKFLVIMVFLLALFLVISVLAKRLAGKSVSDITYIVSSGMLNLNSINQSINQSTEGKGKKKMQNLDYKSNIEL